MTADNSKQVSKYTGPVRAMHWVMTVLILTLIAVGWYMAELPDEALNKYDLYPWHKSFGILVFGLLGVRVLLRATSANPPLPGALKQWEKILTKIVHIGLYVVMALMPLSGYLMSAAYPEGNGVQFFGIQLPDFVGKSEEFSHDMHEAHELLASVLVLLLILHVAGALKHRFIDKNPDADVMKRML